MGIRPQLYLLVQEIEAIASQAFEIILIKFRPTISD